MRSLFGMTMGSLPARLRRGASSWIRLSAVAAASSLEMTSTGIGGLSYSVARDAAASDEEKAFWTVAPRRPHLAAGLCGSCPVARGWVASRQKASARCTGLARLRSAPAVNGMAGGGLVIVLLKLTTSPPPDGVAAMHSVGQGRRGAL